MRRKNIWEEGEVKAAAEQAVQDGDMPAIGHRREVLRQEGAQDHRGVFRRPDHRGVYGRPDRQGVHRRPGHQGVHHRRGGHGIRRRVRRDDRGTIRRQDRRDGHGARRQGGHMAAYQ